ncbi:MAG TPA: hypothetical protein VM840_13065 [Actinomycetota bacterium]|jgi:hypothetical protein|nr:hypothetical protein [Actinomycetota bacterium]
MTDLPIVTSRVEPKVIGSCAFCGRDIAAPGDVLVWVDEESYHQPCYQAHLARRMTDEGVRPAV